MDGFISHYSETHIGHSFISYRMHFSTFVPEAQPLKANGDKNHCPRMGVFKPGIQSNPIHPITVTRQANSLGSEKGGNSMLVHSKHSRLDDASCAPAFCEDIRPDTDGIF